MKDFLKSVLGKERVVAGILTMCSVAGIGIWKEGVIVGILCSLGVGAVILFIFIFLTFILALDFLVSP